MVANKKSKFSLAKYRREYLEFIKDVDKKTLAMWAFDCARRVLPYFEEKYPKDKRPRYALGTLQEWIETGKFSMAVIRKASLDAHSSARVADETSPARSAARACGQAVATAHVATHAIGAALYALQAIHKASQPQKADTQVEKEQNWQRSHLLKLTNLKTSV